MTIPEFMQRAEVLKMEIERAAPPPPSREIKIHQGSVGNSYAAIFSSFLDDGVTTITVDDPYIRNPHQVIHFDTLVK